ncbi:Na+:H+ antiporter [Betaproteobacteria bacterium]|nr:Na+:H+ antiporter [Betaproteobacteria bacterium]GHT94423.1 Na+:H+ antiporter [Betaproteobacteria bacterium]GHU03594.1 Na+:H+ antiporter [Betaproteobacteria bacterium]GHU11784.1 Na+:H+ antiporter [Betaproteobacteria bacterium]GHU22272.1 Na+:H+ antiporter [Betaproteobacteria bacterium]
MHEIEVVLAMLLAVVASGYLVRVLPFSVPIPLVQIVLGAAIAVVGGSAVGLQPEFFMFAFLPPLLFLDGWHIPKADLLRDKVVIIELAFGLVLFTVFGAGFLIHWMIPGMPLAVAFALAAVVSPTDPVAVSSIVARCPIPKRLMHILEGESLLNDASGLVCFRFAVAAALTGSFSIVSASGTFLWMALAGLALGVAVTLAIAQTQRWLSRHLGEETGSPILISLLTPFGAYLAAEHFGASGILAAVAAGVTMSYVELSGRALATTRLQRTAVWATVRFALNGVMFVLLGEQLPGILNRAAIAVQETGHRSAWWLIVYAFAITVILAVLRFAWVWVTLKLLLYRAQRNGAERENPDWRVVAVVSIAGVRGAITLAGVLTLPLLMRGGEPFPARDLAIFLAAVVILISLVVAAIGLPRLVKGLAVPDEPVELREENEARREAAAEAVRAIEEACHTQGTSNVTEAERYAQAAVRVMENYRHRLKQEEPEGGGTSGESLRASDRAEIVLRLAALQAERETIFRLARSGRISDECSRRLVHQIDLSEARYR